MYNVLSTYLVSNTPFVSFSTCTGIELAPEWRKCIIGAPAVAGGSVDSPTVMRLGKFSNLDFHLLCAQTVQNLPQTPVLSFFGSHGGHLGKSARSTGQESLSIECALEFDIRPIFSCLPVLPNGIENSH